MIRGAKGSAKTTAVRGMAPLLGKAEYPIVELPLGATEDRVVGSLDVAAVLESSKYQFQPGLLSQADGGVLYVDEINLLKDHLVDVLLDAAATGFVHVEREGLSHTAQTSFILVGTMNPEEGELRPQLLDRFGFSVESEPVSDPAQRVEIVRRRLAYDADPSGFTQKWEDSTRQLRARLRTARELLPTVEISDEVVLRISHIATHAGVDGLRADVVMTRAACAHAARQGRSTVTDEDLREAALLALPHRRRRAPFDPPQMSEDQISELLQASAPPQTPPASAPPQTAPSGIPHTPPPGASAVRKPTALAKRSSSF
ncbi:ATP-binding protein [Lawsonella clevelandensis]|uniref:ATP-binding protein n=1 Tax=Lawsonella clevelandensis TaxID=1528099 RepID=UPI003C6CC57C